MNLDEGAGFQLTTELLSGVRDAGSYATPLCILIIRDGALHVLQKSDDQPLSFNGKPGREFVVRPGDFLEIARFYVEFLEAPHRSSEDGNETHFLDVADLSPRSRDNGQAHAAIIPPRPLVRSAEPEQPNPFSYSSETADSQDNGTPPSISSIVASGYDQASTPETPEAQPDSELAAEQISADPSTEVPDEGEHSPPVDKETTSEALPTPELDTSDPPSSPPVPTTPPRPDLTPLAVHERQSSVTGGSSYARFSPLNSSRTIVNGSVSRPVGAEEVDLQHRSQESRAKLKRQKPAPAAEEKTDRHKTITREVTGFLQSRSGHIGTSLIVALLASGFISRIVVSALSDLPAIDMFYGTAIGLVLTMVCALTSVRLNRFLDTDGTFDGYSLFYAWALVGAMPLAYALRLPERLAILSLAAFVMIVLIVFAIRYKPRRGRFLGTSIMSFCALAIFLYGLTHSLHLQQEPAIQAEYTEPHFRRPPPMNRYAPPPAPTVQAPYPDPQRQAMTIGPAPGPTPNPPASNPNGQPPGKNTLATRSHSPSSPVRAPAAADPGAVHGMVDTLAAEEFFTAVRTGNLPVVKDLIERKVVNPDLALDKGNTALIYAAANGRLNIAEYLVSKNVNINAQDLNGTTALMWAVFRGHKDIAKLLLNHRANTEVRREDGDRAVDIARKWKEKDLVRLLERVNR